MQNQYKEMREEIIGMQIKFAQLDKEERKDPDVINAVNKLNQTRSALEVLWMKTAKTPKK